MIKDAEACIKNGDIQGALSSLKAHIRDNPADVEPRIFLFQILAVTGDWDKALTQLNVSADLDSGALLMAQTCRELINCEDFRESVFNGQRSPLVFGEPQQWLVTLIQSLKASSEGDGSTALRGTQSAFETADTLSGTINGESFEWIADADMRLGPATEVIVNGKYYWIPFTNIAEIKCHEPEDLRDLVWMPCEFTWKNGGEAVGFLPVKYAGKSTDDQISLSRKTLWSDLGDEFYVGEGQRVFTTDKEDYPLLQIRHIVLDHSAVELDDAAAAADSSAG